MSGHREYIGNGHREYIGPIRPDHDLAWDRLCLNHGGDEPSSEWRAGFNHAMQTMALWLDFQVSTVPEECAWALGRGPGLSSIGMYKSCLLGRLVRGETIRRRPCPTHKGRMKIFIRESEAAQYACCHGLGWLPNSAETDVPKDLSWGDDDFHRLTHPWRSPHWRDLPHQAPSER